MARRRPAKLAYLLLSLGLSFGFVAVVAAVAHASWFRLPAGVADRDYVSLGRESADGAFHHVSLADARNIAERVPELAWFYRKRLPDWGSNLLSIRLPDGTTREANAFGVPGDFFTILGMQAHVGRLQGTAEGVPVAILGHALWRDAYAANANVAGELLHIVDGASVPIAGVAPPGFAGIVPSQTAAAWLLNPRFDMLPPHGFGAGPEVFQRLPNVDLFGTFGTPGGSGASDRSADSTAKLRALIADYRFDAEMIAVEQAGSDGEMKTTHMISFGISPQDRLAVADGLETNPPLRREVVQKIAWLACIVVLLMAMTLVSLVDFMMAEHVARQGEQAVRIALGATPLDVFRQTLAENALWLAILAALAWLAFDYLAEVLLGVAPFSTYVRTLSGDALGAGLGIGAALLLAAFSISGAYLSWFASRTSRSFSAMRAASKLPRAMRCVLLAVAGASLLFVFSLASRYAADSRLSLDLGNPDASMVLIQRQIDIGNSGEWHPPEGLDEAVAAIPGVSAAGRTLMRPLAPAGHVHSLRGTVADRPDLAETPFFENRASPGFFAALRAPLLAGKMIAADASTEVVVSRTAAVALAGSPEAALGMSFTFRGDTNTRPALDPVIVVGVVEDIPYGNYANAEKRIIYYGVRQPSAWQSWVIDYSGKSADLVAALGQLPQIADWDITVSDTPAMVFRKQFVARQSIEILLAGASAFALLLALAGVANSLARTVAEAQQAIGITFALGATASQVGHRYCGEVLRDLLVATAFVSVAAVVAKLTAPDFVAVLAAWQLAPTALCLVAVCVVLSYGLVRRLARRSSANTLIHGVAS